MKPLKTLGPTAFLAATIACTGSSAFRQAREEEALQHWDLAVLKYSSALDSDPQSARYQIALKRAKVKASQFHFEKGKLYRSSGRPELAVVELEQAVVLDTTNQYAESELRKARDETARVAAERSGETRMEAAKRRTRGVRARAPMLEPASDKPINLNFPSPKPIKQIYQALAAGAGINVIFDPQLKDDNVSIVLTNMEFQRALETLMRQENHFYKVIDEKTLLIASDTPQNRKTYEDLVIRTFFLSNADATEVSNALRNLLLTQRIYPNKAENSITIRDTADKVAVAERIVEQNDKQLSEVVVDVELLQINTTKKEDLGLLLSTYSTSASAPAPGGTTDLGSTLKDTFTWDQLKALTVRSFGFTLPTASYNFIKNNADFEILARPQLRISEGQKAQLVIGDRTPIPTTTFQSQFAAGGSTVATPITSFQYQDVGIKIEVEPRVHHNKEVTMKLTLEVSQVGEPVKVAGQEQPVIGTRTISSTIRLKDGETNFLAGLYRSDKKRSKNFVPFLGEIPILGRLFSNTTKMDETKDLILTLTPHIIRTPDVTEEDLTPLYVGTDANISFQGTPRLETPGGAAGPFDFGRREPPPLSRPVPGPQAPTPVPLAPAGPPSDPFRPPSPQQAVPPQTPPPQAEVRPPGTLGAQAAALTAATGGGLHFDFDPASATLAPGQRQSIILRARGEDAMANASLAIRFDPAVVAAVAVRPVLADGGVADAHIEPGRVVIEIPSSVTVSGTRAIAEILLQGVAPGRSTLVYEKPVPGGTITLSEGVVEVR